MNLDALRGALGSASTKFPRDVLVHTPERFDSQVDLLVEATTGAMSGRSLRECQLLSWITRSRDIQDWYIGVGQWSGAYRTAVRNEKRSVQTP
jgi:hypothetical protein